MKRSLRASVITVLLLAAMVFGYTQLLASTCSGEELVRVLASSATANQLSTIATEWGREEPATRDGTCARVAVQGRDSAQVAVTLAAGWDTPDDPPPEVWVPTATAWVRQAGASDLAAPLLPEELPSIARSVAVIALPEPMAAALDWPQTQLDEDQRLRWETLLGEFGDRGGWARFGHPEWGQFRFGMGNPARDTAGLLTLTAVGAPPPDDPDEGGPDSEPAADLESVFALSELLEPDLYHETTEQLLIRLSEADQAGAEAVLDHISAFPALEQEVLSYNRSNPQVPLAAIYPADATVEADHPYVILRGEWVTERKREVAESFLAYVQSDGPQATLRAAGFRGSDGTPGADLAQQHGLLPDPAAAPRPAPASGAVIVTMDRWTALTQQLNVLMVLDVSESMLVADPRNGALRLEVLKSGAAEAVDLFETEDQLGLWAFATALDGELDYQSLVPLGSLADEMDDGRTREEQVRAAIADLLAGGGSGLYNTVEAAYDTMLANYNDQARNLVLVITDGQDETLGRPTISLDDLLTRLQANPDGGGQVRVATVGVGPEADLPSLTEIAEATGAQAYHSEDGSDLGEVLRDAILGNST